MASWCRACETAPCCCAATSFTAKPRAWSAATFAKHGPAPVAPDAWGQAKAGELEARMAALVAELADGRPLDEAGAIRLRWDIEAIAGWRDRRDRWNERMASMYVAIVRRELDLLRVSADGGRSLETVWHRFQRCNAELGALSGWVFEAVREMRKRKEAAA